MIPAEYTAWTSPKAAQYLKPFIEENIPGFEFKNFAKIISECPIDLDIEG